MVVYRIAKEKYITDLSGIGAKRYGGRWNPKGYAILYTSENRSLAALEFLIHVDKKTIPNDLKMIALELPEDSINEFDEMMFQKIISSSDAIFKLNEEGKNWIEAKSSLSLKVPSVIISGEKNVLLNPNHTLFPSIKILKIDDFIFEERFFL